LLPVLFVILGLPHFSLAEQAAVPPSSSISESVTAHAKLFLKNRFPRAEACRGCHAGHYREWSVSQHAYAQLGPIFSSMQVTLNKLTSYTLGDFCVRCHNPVGMMTGEAPYISNLDRNPISREGVTCIACHRVGKDYGKTNARFPIVEGDITQPVWGQSGGGELKRVLNDSRNYKVTPDPKKRGRKIHRDAKRFFALSNAASCGMCHDVTVASGLRMFETFSEYKNSPAAARGVTCQDCHMGKEPGNASKGYRHGPAAKIGGKGTKPTKLTNHMFSGPDHSIIHPGLFPHNPRAAQLASPREWLQFDHKAGWGTDNYENNLLGSVKFPKRWASADDRFDARQIINDQQKLLAEAHEQRVRLLRNGFGLEHLVVGEVSPDGLEFSIDVRNLTDGHNAPSALPERLVFLDVTVTGPSGNVVFRSGDRDPNGDLRDEHSLYVHNGEIEPDPQLFSLQSYFITRNQRGGERVQVLPVNHSLDPLPFVRPFPRPTILTGQPAGARVHRRFIEPNGRRTAQYVVAPASLRETGKYRIEIRLIAQTLPVNVVAAVKDVGFDYGLSPRAVADAVVAGAVVLSTLSKQVTLK
jgi:hypothetical protein